MTKEEFYRALSHTSMEATLTERKTLMRLANAIMQRDKLLFDSLANL